MVDARSGVEELLRNCTAEWSTREFDLTLAIAALEGDETTVLAVLDAETRRLTRVRRYRLDHEPDVATVGLRHLERAAEAVRARPADALLQIRERVDAFDAANPDRPIEQSLVRFWTAVFPDLSAVEFVEAEASVAEEDQLTVAAPSVRGAATQTHVICV